MDNLPSDIPKYKLHRGFVAIFPLAFGVSPWTVKEKLNYPLRPNHHPIDVTITLVTQEEAQEAVKKIESLSVVEELNKWMTANYDNEKHQPYISLYPILKYFVPGVQELDQLGVNFTRFPSKPIVQEKCGKL